jgi:hypothetical protein
MHLLRQGVPLIRRVRLKTAQLNHLRVLWLHAILLEMSKLQLRFDILLDGEGELLVRLALGCDRRLLCNHNHLLLRWLHWPAGLRITGQVGAGRRPFVRGLLDALLRLAHRGFFDAAGGSF